MSCSNERGLGIGSTEKCPIQCEKPTVASVCTSQPANHIFSSLTRQHCSSQRRDQPYSLRRHSGRRVIAKTRDPAKTSVGPRLRERDMDYCRRTGLAGTSLPIVRSLAHNRTNYFSSPKKRAYRKRPSSGSTCTTIRQISIYYRIATSGSG